jgi:hypothetical protein
VFSFPQRPRPCVAAAYLPADESRARARRVAVSPSGWYGRRSLTASKPSGISRRITSVSEPPSASATSCGAVRPSQAAASAVSSFVDQNGCRGPRLACSGASRTRPGRGAPEASRSGLPSSGERPLPQQAPFWLRAPGSRRPNARGSRRSPPGSDRRGGSSTRWTYSSSDHGSPAWPTWWPVGPCFSTHLLGGAKSSGRGRSGPVGVRAWRPHAYTNRAPTAGASG